MAALVQLDIESLVAGGDGLARHEGRVVFVPGTVPGDRVEAELEAASGGRPARARVRRVLTPSPERVEAGCPHADRCGGCAWLAVSATAQAREKEALFYETLARLGGLRREQIPRAEGLLPSATPLRYRVRARLRVSRGQLGYSGAASHEHVAIRECRLLVPPLEAAVLRLQRALDASGGLRRLDEVAVACDPSRTTAAFFVEATTPAVEARAERLMREAGLDGALVVPREGRPRVLGEALLSWPAAHAPGVTLHGRADLFAQANQATNPMLVGEVLDRASGARRVLELYCGAGNFTFALARAGAEVLALEGLGESLELARRSAREAGIDTVRFVAGEALSVARGLAREGERFDTLVLDPPRAGAKGLAAIALGLGVRRIVYVSCDPATLARDVRELNAAGFRPTVARPIDMFPQTPHVEAVIALEREWTPA